MKIKHIVLCVLLFYGLDGNAQDSIVRYRNIFKLKPFALLSGKICADYEWAITQRNTLNIEAAVFNSSSDGLYDLLNNQPFIDFDPPYSSERLGFSLRPEWRRYPKRKKFPTGPYLGGFLKYSYFEEDFRDRLHSPSENSPGKINVSYSAKAHQVGIGSTVGGQLIGKHGMVIDMYVGAGLQYSILSKTYDYSYANDAVYRSERNRRPLSNGPGLNLTGGLCIGYTYNKALVRKDFRRMNDAAKAKRDSIRATTHRAWSRMTYTPLAAERKNILSNGLGNLILNANLSYERYLAHRFSAKISVSRMYNFAVFGNESSPPDTLIEEDYIAWQAAVFMKWYIGAIPKAFPKGAYLGLVYRPRYVTYSFKDLYSDSTGVRCDFRERIFQHGFGAVAGYQYMTRKGLTVDFFLGPLLVLNRSTREYADPQVNDEVLNAKFRGFDGYYKEFLNLISGIHIGYAF